VGYYQGKSGCASLQQQRRFAQSCGRRLSHNYSKNAPTYVTGDMEAHPFVCPASRCTYGFTGHVTKAYVSDSNQIMVAYWSVYGDFSPTLYVSNIVCPLGVHVKIVLMIQITALSVKLQTELCLEHDITLCTMFRFVLDMTSCVSRHISYPCRVIRK